jgi:hypothetical protein
MPFYGINSFLRDTKNIPEFTGSALVAGTIVLYTSFSLRKIRLNFKYANPRPLLRMTQCTGLVETRMFEMQIRNKVFMTNHPPVGTL